MSRKLVSNFSLILPVLFLAPQSIASPFYLFSGSFSARYAQHLTAPQNQASERFEVNAAQYAKFNQAWKARFSLRAWGDTVYAQNPSEYPQSLQDQDSQEIRLRDAYVQWEDGDFLLKVGNQQVVWGEAFGYQYSDIINPKDFRDGGFGDPSDVRLPVPMVNVTALVGNGSLQLLYIPQPYFDLVPLPGSDFAIPYSAATGYPNVNIKRQVSLPVPAHEEIGGKLDYLFGSLDLAAYTFWYYDHEPYYLLDPSTTKTDLVLDEAHARVQTSGVTASLDLGEWVLRSEGLLTRNQVLPDVENGFLGQDKTDNITYVVGVDFPDWDKFIMSLQWSESRLTRPDLGIFRPVRQQLVSLQLQKKTIGHQKLSLLYMFEPSDSGYRGEIKYLWPLSSQVELTLGADVLAGPPASEFGRLSRGSRVFVTLKSFFEG